MCCLYGLLDYQHRLSSRNLAYATTVLGIECEVRGTDATGIAYLHRDRLSVYKRPVPAHKLRIRLPSDCHVVTLKQIVVRPIGDAYEILAGHNRVNVA